MPYRANRGGHAPGHLRDAFRDCLEQRGGPWWAALATGDALLLSDPRLRALSERWSARERARWLVGQLWDCTDTLPGADCQALGLPRGSSYAMAARLLRATL